MKNTITKQDIARTGKAAYAVLLPILTVLGIYASGIEAQDKGLYALPLQDQPAAMSGTVKQGSANQNIDTKNGGKIQKKRKFHSPAKRVTKRKSTVFRSGNTVLSITETTHYRERRHKHR